MAGPTGRLCAKTGRGQSGVLPCFFLRFSSRLVFRIPRALVSLGRVPGGRVPPCSEPRAAPGEGVAKPLPLPAHLPMAVVTPGPARQ